MIFLLRGTIFLGDIFQGGDNGPETITVKNVPHGITVMYYVKDFSNKVGKTMSWKDSQAKGNLFAPNGGGMLLTIYY